MLDTSSHHGGDAASEDVDMEDLTDLTESLPQYSVHEKSKDDTQYKVDEDSDAMSDVTQSQSTGQTSSPSVEETHSHASFNEAARPHGDAEERVEPEQLAHYFTGREVDLKNFKEPSLCQQHPNHREALMAAHIRYTSFAVTVWVNFDAAEQVFFEGNRAEACGKLRLPEPKHQELASMGADVLRFQHVRLYISTPFRVLARLDLDIVQQDDGSAQLQVTGEMLVTADTLYNYLNRKLIWIRRYGSANNLAALTLENLELFASGMRRTSKVKQDGVWEQPAYGGGEWANVEEP